MTNSDSEFTDRQQQELAQTAKDLGFNQPQQDEMATTATAVRVQARKEAHRWSIRQFLAYTWLVVVLIVAVGLYERALTVSNNQFKHSVTQNAQVNYQNRVSLTAQSCADSNSQASALKIVSQGLQSLVVSESSLLIRQFHVSPKNPQITLFNTLEKEFARSEQQIKTVNCNARTQSIPKPTQIVKH
jgi:hypothetical protein